MQHIAPCAIILSLLDIQLSKINALQFLAAAQAVPA